MGVYIAVDAEDGRDTGWDFGLAGDRQLAGVLIELPRETRMTVDPTDPMLEPCEDGFRPADFAAWKAAEEVHPEPHNPGRFASLIALLEANEDYWVRISW